MKKLFLIFFLVNFLSCRKQDNSFSIVGNWELRKLEGGIIAEVDYPPGTGPIYSFTTDGKFTYSLHNTVNNSGSYALKPSFVAGNWILKLTGDVRNGNSIDTVTLTKDYLTFLPFANCCDIAAMVYERIHF